MQLKETLSVKREKPRSSGRGWIALILILTQIGQRFIQMKFSTLLWLRKGYKPLSVYKPC